MPPQAEPSARVQTRPPAPPALISPSTGCGKPRGAGGELSLAFSNRTGEYLLTFPPGYAPDVPAPLVFAFHGYTRTHLQMHGEDASRLTEEIGTRAIVAYVKSQGESWDRPGELEPSLELFDALYAHLLASHCVDVEQVFALGISSGGFFTTEVACRHPERLAAAAVVAGALHTECRSRMPILFVHGPADTEVPISRGWHARDHFLAANGCSARTLPTGVEQCVEHDGCYPGYPLWWCQHDEPTYGNTNHGWPSFGSHAIATFFFSSLGAPLAGESGNSIENGRFDTGSEPWQSSFTAPASGSMQTRAGALCLSVDERGQNTWDAQLFYDRLELEAGKRYQIDFRVWASSPTLLRARLGLSAPPYREYWVRYMELSTEPRRWVDSILMGVPSGGAATLAFQGAGAAARSVPVTFCIDDVRLTTW